jgi:hypothetical protein
MLGPIADVGYFPRIRRPVLATVLVVNGWRQVDGSSFGYLVMALFVGSPRNVVWSTVFGRSPGAGWGGA